MSDNNGDLRPDGYEPNAENPAPNQAGSADQAGASQWDGSATQSFQPEQGYPQDGQGYGQYPQVNNQDNQAFQPEGQGYQQSAYTPHETQAFGAQQPYAAPGYGDENQPYTTDQYNQSGYQPDQYGQQGYGHQAYPPSGQPAGGYQASYGGYDGTGGGGYPPYGGGYGQQPPKGKGPLIAWIVLGIILLGAIVVGILFGTGFFDSDEDDAGPTGTEPLTVIPTTEDPTTEDPTTEDPTTAAPTTSAPTTSSPASYGDDPMLDGLWDQCADGDMVACDDLWYEADFDSEYYEFANTCGETAEASYGLCEYGLNTGGASGYGDDPMLDGLWDQCADGDMVACDDLWYESDYDSEYYDFANTCGETADASYGMCEYGIGSGTGSGEASSYGDDPILDELWDVCEGGDFEACDELWWDTPIGSEYELFAESCGGRTDEPASGTCVFRSEMGEF